MPLRVLPKLIGVQLVNFHIQLYFKNTAPPFEALMYEFDAENKGDNGDLHTTYIGKGKRDDSESLMCYHCFSSQHSKISFFSKHSNIKPALRVELLQGVT